MDQQCIKAFVTSIRNVFQTMMQLEVRVGTPMLKDTAQAPHDVSGIIGMSGDITGTVVISFPEATAVRVASILAGSDMPATHPDFPDAIGEIVNMVSGGAKALFGGRKASISCPSVVRGPGHVVAAPKDTPCIAIPCGTDCGDFVIEVAIRVPNAAAQPATAAGVAA
ncbi:MAG: chemotaxis protein CheX [Phycisphaerales bacterium]